MNNRGTVIPFIRKNGENKQIDNSGEILKDNQCGFELYKFDTIKSSKNSAKDIIDNFIGYNWTKEDMVGAIISIDLIGNSGIEINDDDDDLVYSLMEIDYTILYNEILEFVCEIGRLNYEEGGFEFKYDPVSGLIYFIKTNDGIADESYIIDIRLINEEDFSFTSIEINCEGNIMFSFGKEGSAKTGFNPITDMYYEEDLNGLGDNEKKHIKSMDINRDDMIGAIISNFGDLLVSEIDRLDSLEGYGTFELLTLLTEIIFNNFGEKYNFIIEPFSNIYLQQCVNDGNDSYIIDLKYEFILDTVAYETSINILHEDDVLFTINGGNITNNHK